MGDGAPELQAFFMLLMFIFQDRVKEQIFKNDVIKDFSTKSLHSLMSCILAVRYQRSLSWSLFSSVSEHRGRSGVCSLQFNAWP